MVQRLFDIVEQRANRSPNAILLAAKENGEWRTYSGKEVWETAQQLAGGLLTLGIANQVLEPEQQEKIAIISPNRPEWMLADVAVQLTGGILTPVYPTISPAELVYILNEAGVHTLFVANADIYARFKDAFNEIPTLKNIYSFDVLEGVKHWKTLLEKNGRPDASVISRINGGTLATIIYTSGTTGNPKGVMLSHTIPKE